MMNRVMLVGVLITALAAGCDRGADPAVETNAQAETAASLPPSLRLAAAPADAKGVTATKTSVATGDRVTIRGVVAGRAEPIASNRAILTLLDASVKTCDQTGDGCETPWDACCEPSEVLAKNSLTVQVVDGEGRPVKASLASIDGVKPLAKLTVSGVAKVSDDGVVIVNADGFHVD